MAGPIASLFVALGLDARAYTAGLKSANKASKEFVDQAGINWSKVGGSLSTIGLNLTKSVSLPLLGAGVAAFKFASDLNEASSKAATVYGAAAGKIVKSSESMEDGLDQAKFLDIAGTFGALLKNMGFTADAAADLSLKWIGLAQDMASFHNLEVPEALQAIQSALAGEFEPLKRFGVALNVTTIKEKALEMGLWDGHGALSAQAKALVVNAELFKQQKDVIGDFDRTADGAANTTKMLWSNFKDTAAAIGTELLPMGIELLKTVNGWIKSFKELDPGTRKLIVQLGLAAAAAGPLLFVGGKLISALSTMGKVAGIAADMFAKVLIPRLAVTTTEMAATEKASLGLKGAMGGIAVAAAAFAAGVLIANEAGNELEGQYTRGTAALQAMTDATPEQIAQIKESGRVALERADALKFMGFWDTEASVALRELGKEAEATAERLSNKQMWADWVPDIASHIRDERADTVAAAEELGEAIPAAVSTGMAGAFSAVPDAWKKVAAANVEAMAAPFRALGEDIDGQIGLGMQANAKAVFDSSLDLADLIKNGLTPEALGMQAIGKEYIDLVREGMKSQVIGAKETAQAIAIQAINSIEDAGLQGAEGQKGLHAIGVYFDELLASGMTGPNALLALESAGVDASSEALAGVRSKYPQYFTTGQNLADKVSAGIDSRAWTSWGYKTAGAWLTGFKNHFEAFSWANLINSTVGPKFSGQSPPKEGPLHEIDRWGFNVGLAWIKGFGQALGGGLGSLRPPSLTLPVMPPLSPLGVPGMALAGAGGLPPMIVNIYGLFGGPAGLDQLDDALEGRRRQRVRGANRQSRR